MMAASQVAPEIGVKAACQALDLSRASFYRRRRPRLAEERPRSPSPRALLAEERQQILAVLNSDRFADRNCSTHPAEKQVLSDFVLGLRQICS